MRLIASLALMGLLVSCQSGIEPIPSATASTVGSLAPTGAPLSAQPTSPIRGTVAGSWGKVTDLPTARAGAATVVFEERIIVVGGLGGPRAVERFDPATRQWDRLADFPYPVDNAMAAAIDEGVDAGIFVFGGYVNGAPSKRTWYLPRDDDLWRELNAMPEARAAGGAVTIGSKIYIVGGVSSPTPGVEALALPTLEYDFHGPLGAPWRVRSAIPTPREHLAVAAIGSRACALGGRQLSAARNVTAFECYDPATDAWDQLSPLPTPRSSFGAGIVAGRVVLIGGEQPAGTMKEVEVYDVGSMTWSRGPDAPTPRQGLAVAAISGIVYALGGSPTPGGAAQTKVCEALTLR